jgi:hypothetical protein
VLLEIEIVWDVMLCHFRTLGTTCAMIGVTFNKTWTFGYILDKILVSLHQHMGHGAGGEQWFKYLAWCTV